MSKTVKMMLVVVAVLFCGACGGPVKQLRTDEIINAGAQAATAIAPAGDAINRGITDGAKAIQPISGGLLDGVRGVEGAVATAMPTK